MVSAVNQPSVQLRATQEIVGCFEVKGQKVWITNISHKDHGPGFQKKDLDLSKPNPQMLDELDKATKAFKAHFDNLSSGDQDKVLKKLADGEDVTFKLKRDFKAWGTAGYRIMDPLRALIASPLKLVPMWGDQLFETAKYGLEKLTGRSMGEYTIEEVVDEDGNEIIQPKNKSQPLSKSTEEIDFSQFSEGVAPTNSSTKRKTSSYITEAPADLRPFLSETVVNGDCLPDAVAQGLLRKYPGGSNLPSGGNMPQPIKDAITRGDKAQLMTALRTAASEQITNWGLNDDTAILSMLHAIRDEAAVRSSFAGIDGTLLNKIRAQANNAAQFTQDERRTIRAACTAHVQRAGAYCDAPFIKALTNIDIPICALTSDQQGAVAFAAGGDIEDPIYVYRPQGNAHYLAVNPQAADDFQEILPDLEV